MGTLLKALFIALIVLGLTTAAGLAIMAGVAGTHEVKPIPIPRDSSLATMATMWNYADAYRRPMEYGTFRDLAQMIDNVSIKGDGEIHRNAKEVVFAGRLPGIDYQVAYILDRDTYPYAVEMVTCYRLKNDEGRYLFKLWRPIHRCLAPYMLDRLGSAAPS